jgi:hypothetical protein
MGKEIECIVMPAFRKASMGGIGTGNLTASAARLCNTILTLRSNGNGNSDFTVEYYLWATLLALNRGLGDGKQFRLPISSENLDLRRVISESFGAALGAMLVAKDLGARWESMVQVTSKDVAVPTGKTVSRRPDLIFETASGANILESKGTTSLDSMGRMIRSGYDQAKNTPIATHKIVGRYVTCAFLPLEGHKSDPIIKVRDPEEDTNLEPVVTLHRRVVDSAYPLHYSRVASMAGLGALSAYLHESAYEPFSAKLLESRSAAEREVEAAIGMKGMSFELNERRIIGRSFRVPSVLTSDGQCPFLEVKVGIDAAVARSLLTLSRDRLRQEIGSINEINQPLVSMLSDGSAVSIVSRKKPETMASNPLLDDYWKLVSSGTVKERKEERKARVLVLAQ